MTALASGRSSPAALLNPVNPSIATSSMRSRHVSGWEASQVLRLFIIEGVGVVGGVGRVVAG